MFDFKKGKSSDKVLSEQEIQQKLYGRFLTNKNSVAGASEAYTRPAPKASSSSSSAVLFPEDTAEELHTENKPSELISEARPVEKKIERKEPSAAPISKDLFREKFQAQENDLLKTVRTKTAAPKISFPKVIPNLKIPKLPVAQIFSAVSSAAAAIFNAVFGVIFAIGRVVDFRKEGVRTGLAWGSGVVMLVLLLAAIQGLNSKREIAMQTAVPKPPKKITAKAAAKKAIPAAVPSAAEQKESTSAAERNKVPLTPVEEETAAVKKTPAADISNGRFVIQVATYVIRDDANRLLQDLQKIEPKSFVKGLSRSSGKTYYSVFLGRFESFQAGQQALAKFKKTDLSRSFKDAFIRTLDA